MPFDVHKAQRSVDFIQKLCTHTKGIWNGVRFNLLPWELDVVWRFFGTVRDDGYRQYRTCYVEIPKKNGKSELGAAIALIGLVGDGEMGAEVYSAAGDREQASLVYRVAAGMVKNNAVLRTRLKHIASRKRIVDYKTGSFYQVLSAEAYTKHGVSPSCIVFDELHTQPTRELWDTLIEGTDAARRQQIIFVITTAGIYDLNSIAWEVHDYARQVRDGIIDDPSFMPVIYAADPDDDWEDEKVWRKANPSLGHIFDIDNIREHYAQAKANPARQNNFRRFRLNQWVNQVTRWMPMDLWDVCGGSFDKNSLIGQVCYGGLDLSSTMDLTAYVLMFPPIDGDEGWRAVCKFYIPEDTILNKERTDRVPYLRWRDAGFITVTPGNVVDYAYIRRDIVSDSKLYDLREVAYDPWGGLKLAVELQDEDGINMVEHRQGYYSMSPPMKELLRLVIAGDLRHCGNPVLRWNADNLVVKSDAADNVKPEKNRARERIDGMVALIMAVGRATANAANSGRSVYETRKLRVL